MIIKEKAIFWMLLPALIALLAAGINFQAKKKQSLEEFLKDIESVTEKAKARKKPAKMDWDIEDLKRKELPEDYASLEERNIFIRPASEMKSKPSADIVPLEDEKPKKPAFVYKGRMMVGEKETVIIEDQNTGKSFSVKEGDMAGDFTVLNIDEKRILLRKKDGEEIEITTLKEEKK